MTDIVVVDDNDGLFSYLADGLEKSFYVRRYTSSGLWAFGEGKPVNIILTDGNNNMLSDKGVVILGDISDYKCVIHRDYSYVIANSASYTQMDSLLFSDLPVITCGCSAMDTFSYTSITDDFLTVSLNRKIKTMSKKNVQPFEIPRPIKDGENVYWIMALVAVSLLLDDNNQEFGKLYS